MSEGQQTAPVVQESGSDRAKARRAERDASGELYVDHSIFVGIEACLTRNGKTVAHVVNYADAVEIAAKCASSTSGPVPATNQAGEIALLPCPFCGSAGAVLVPQTSMVECVDCGAIGPGVEGDDGAMLWNTRAARVPIAPQDGPCFLCAGKCRGHDLADPVAWEPEVGSVAALARAKAGA